VVVDTAEGGTDERRTRPTAARAIHASTGSQLIDRVLSKGGKMPSEKAVFMAAKAIATKTHRELWAQQKH
jgi:hypothetical protein